MPGLIWAGVEFLPRHTGGHASWEDPNDIWALERAGGTAGVARVY